MANFLDYLDWRGDLSFAQSPFNPVDNLILSQLSYVAFDGVVPGFDDTPSSVSLTEAAERLLSGDRTANPTLTQQNCSLLSALAKSARFQTARLTFYCNDRNIAEEKQFSAVTVRLDDRSAFIAFRGTDSTIAGWKEDFNMTFTCPIPAQTEAVRYLEHVTASLSCPLRVGGHSKGGNLAVYAAASCPEEAQGNLLAVYDNDGPGLSAAFLESTGYQRMQDRIHTFLPQSSVIGMLLEHCETYTIVRSSRSGLMQHDPYSWKVLGPNFEIAEEFTAGSRLVDATLNQWLASMDVETRRTFIDTLYQVLEKTGAERLEDLTDNWRNNMFTVLDALKNTDKETRKMIRDVLGALFRIMHKQIKRAVEKEPLLPDGRDKAVLPKE